MTKFKFFCLSIHKRQSESVSIGFHETTFLLFFNTFFKEWNCGYCGFRNQLSQEDCEMCEKERYENIGASWKCSVCENINTVGYRYCTMCQHERYKAIEGEFAQDVNVFFLTKIFTT